MREARTKTAADRIGDQREHNRNRPCLAGKYGDRRCGLTEDRIGSPIDQFFCESLNLVRISGTPAKVDSEIVTFPPTQFRELVPKRREPRRRSRIALRPGHQHADQPHLLALLRVRGERPCYG